MANSFFKFKEFTIHQDRCGMKVTTDACLFGALVSEKLAGTSGKVLDIGTGTGLLTLMLAQNIIASIDAIEIEQNAFEQARINFENSPWHERIHLSHMAFQDFYTRSISSPTEHQYNHIICNPPFFSQHLTGQNAAKSQALHDKNDLLTTLAQGIDALLNTNGLFHVLLPGYEMTVLTDRLKTQGLYPQSEVTVYQKEGKPIFRSIVSFGREIVGKPIQSTVYIYNTGRDYSERFIELLKPFYLHL